MRIRKTFDQRNDVTLFHGDCLRLLQKLPDGAAQLVVTSPPYNVGKEYEKNLGIEDYIEFQRRVIQESVRITRPGGSICWQVGNHVNGHGQMIPLDILLHPLFAAFAETVELRLRNRIVWHFEHGLHCKRRFSGRHESILWYTKGDNYIFNLDAVRVPQKYPGKQAYRGERRGQYTCNPLGKNPGDVWIIPNVKSNHVEKTDHPCQFPIEIPERLILAFTNEGDLVVDPFLGAGTTAVAAVLHKRRVAGADIKKEYLAVARQRVTAAVAGRLKRRPFGKPVYQPEPNTRLTTSPFNRCAVETLYLTSAL
ncbi:MAG: site-specific DNA-methyltransferase [Verrucomicrobiota bacterium]|jgi:adenine-specific DNA-methyltransferase